MRGLDLPHRRYSMPETIMRKFRLGQSSSSSDSSRSSTRQRRHVPRRKQNTKLSKINRSSQTSPKCQDKCLSESKLLLDSSPSLLNRRASSVPDLSSSEEEPSSRFSRPLSASERFCGTPSPSQVSCYGGPGHTCALCSKSWSITSSDYTLTQTVSDRTTSTQDSTLSIQSTSPSTPTPVPFTAEQALMLENSIFQPAGNFIAVHTESILIRPINIIDSSDNWHYGFSADDIETQLAMAPQSVGTITEDDIEAITSGRKDRSTSIGDWPVPAEGFPQPLEFVDSETNTAEEKSKCIAIQASKKLLSLGLMTMDTGSQTQNGENESPSPYAQQQPEISVGVPLLRYSDAGLLKSKEEEMRRIGSEFIDFERGRLDKRCQHRDQKTQFNSLLKSSKSFPPSYFDKRAYPSSVDAEVAVTGGNYKDVEEAEAVIARYSAVPRSNSMLVNTSSIDYTSDSDLSLTDSLEDGTENRTKDYPQSKHDTRLVRGEVALDESKNKKLFPKGGDAYAYFLSMTGEQDMIKGCPVPDWLRARLKRREEEIKKLFEVKLNKHQTIIYRRRKRMVRHMENYHGTNTSHASRSKPAKSIRWDDTRHEMPHTIVGVVQESPEHSLQVSPKKPGKDDMTDQEQLSGRSSSQQAVQNMDNNKYVHISEVIKIELSNQLKTVITKEKQISLNHDAFSREGKSIQTSEVINNEDAHNSQKIIMRTNVGNFEIAQNNTMIDLQQADVSTKQPVVEEPKTYEERTEVEIGTQTVPHHMCGNRSLLARPANAPFSFKQFRPLFQSKADDQTVADVLLSAMNEDKETLPGKVSVRQQTGESHSNSEDEMLSRVESSCNTDQPYLSESIQTRESFLDKQHFEPVEIPRITVDKSEQCDEASIDHVSTEILQTEHKECNTDAFSVSAVVQTKETFQDDEKSFVESEKDEVTVISLLSKDKGTDVFAEEEESKSADKSCNTSNPLTTSSVQTENFNAVNEVKPLVVSQPKSTGRKKDVQFVESGLQHTSIQSKKGFGISRQKRDTPTPYCTRSNPDDSLQVLELNVPPCACHMCTFHKRSQATADKKDASGVRSKIGLRKTSDIGKESKKLQKYPTGRRSVSKFQRKFEVIPEEKGGSMESISDETPESKQTSTEWSRTLVTTGTMTKDPGRHVSIQEPPLMEVKVDDTTQTVMHDEGIVQKKVIQVNKKSNVVIGRFRAIPDDLEDEGSSSDLGNLPDGLEVVRQYKGRAALAASNVSGQEELLTLSKGWINFYLLKDNNDLDDINNEEGFQIEGANIDESVQEYTLEIHATPEDYMPEHTLRNGRGSTILPDLPQREMKRSRHTKGQLNRPGAGQVTLPDIHSSSSSSTPENQDGHHPHSTRKHDRQALPGVNDARGSRHEIKARRERRERVTAISKTEPVFMLPTELDHNIETTHSTKAVEVARSEHSVSSITSSTVILSESPSPQQMHFSDRKVQKRSAMYSETNGVGSSWTVTVAGSSGVTNQTPPDVEMRLTFAKPNVRPGADGQERGLMQYNSQQTHHISRSKRQGKMIEEYKHSLRNERHSLQYVPEPRSSRKERARLDGSQKDHDDDHSGRLSPRSKCSEAFSEEGELQVTGLAITPELKPRVPTQSERDLVRRQRYKFTR